MTNHYLAAGLLILAAIGFQALAIYMGYKNNNPYRGGWWW